MIKLVDVEKFYETGAGKTWVLRRINLEVREGEFITIMGPSGAGKSTLLGILGMLDGAWKGEYHLYEHVVHKLDNRRRVELHKRYIGFVFQQYHLLDHLTVAENLDLPLSYRDMKKAERDGIVADSLDRFQIVGKKDLYPNQLSGGQQQLVAVARAVIGNPKLILADEPTGSLDTRRGAEILALLADIAHRRRVAVLLVTHDAQAAVVCDRVHTMRDGRLLEDESSLGSSTTHLRRVSG
jgi:putative ABC transport system ATP-binding protein